MARILIANDDAEFLEMCQNVLEDAGHTVCSVEGGTHALEQARRRRPDLIVVDFQMPDMNGAAAIRALRAAPETASIPILMMSGAAAGRESAKQAGANAFLEKPFRGEELIDSVNSLIGQTAESLNEAAEVELAASAKAHDGAASGELVERLGIGVHEDANPDAPSSLAPAGRTAPPVGTFRSASRADSELTGT